MNEVKPETSGRPQAPVSEQKPAPETESPKAQGAQGAPGPAAKAPEEPQREAPAAKAPAAEPDPVAKPAPEKGAAEQPGQKGATETSASTAPEKSAPEESGKPGGAPAADKARGPVADATNGRPTPPVQSPVAEEAQTGQIPRAGGPTPPWQRGTAPSQSGMPQSTPQTNVPGVGPGLSKQRAGEASQRPGTGAGGPAAAKGAPTGGANPSTRSVVTGAAAPGARAAADRAAAAKAKSAVIDGPTRHIERKDLAKDLPDLSAVKHPSTASPGTGETPQVSAATATTPTTTAVPTVIPASGPLRATVQIRRIDPWSMLKISSVISVSLFFVWMIAVGLLYGVLAGMGVWERLNSAFTDIVSDAGSGALISAGQVFGYATIIGVVNTILLTALATLGAFIYNLCTDLVGGVQATLADPD
ncbi:DUF3566 domain-containing protein [Rhodococcus sp. NPDC047139]|uniref:DUF3566 domain-containing protein n=1 Tax=Rhodococcus sp. NPDC047139 TaxID=3155141 RepID=UPI0033C13343